MEYVKELKGEISQNVTFMSLEHMNRNLTIRQSVIRDRATYNAEVHFLPAPGCKDKFTDMCFLNLFQWCMDNIPGAVVRQLMFRSPAR